MKKIIVIILLLVLGAVAFIWGVPMYQLHFTTIDLNEEKVIYVRTGTTMDELASQIDSEGILSKDKFSKFSADLDFDDSKIEPGKYQITAGMKIKNLIYALKNGNQEVKDVKITFNYCDDLEELAGKVAPFIEADSTELITYISDAKTIEKYGFNRETMPSLFLPDTYEVGEWDMTAEEFVSFMADQWKTFWNDERTTKRKAINLTESEVATLASIIEAEQGIHSQEWETIAGLYLNRLESGMRLQADPTAKFCWSDEEMEGVQRILEIHLQRDCPYNTYIHAGLPPGPIRIPSKKAIDAVLNAEDHKYLYFCAKADNSGLHAFAETYSQHLENARKFWRYMDERGN
jgi:UPF0755 protein